MPLEVVRESSLLGSLSDNDESELCEDRNRAGLAALEVARTEALTGGELVRPSQHRLVRVSLAIPLVEMNGVAATTDAGPIDMTASPDGSTLYVEAGAAGSIDEFHVNASGTLTDLGSIAGLGAGIEGIATD